MFDPVSFLSRQIVGPSVMLALAHGENEHARSQITSGAQGGQCAEWRYEVSGGRVEWSHGDQGGTVAVSRLLAYARERMDEEKAQRVREAYSRYVTAATAGYTLQRSSRAYQADPEGMERKADEYDTASRALEDAAASWWLEEVAGEQCALF